MGYSAMLLYFAFFSAAYAVCDIVFDCTELRNHFRPYIEEHNERSVWTDGENFLYFKMVGENPTWVMADSFEDSASISCSKFFLLFYLFFKQ